MTNKTTAKRLQMALSLTNMNQRELAEKSGISESSISHYINGTHTPGNLKAGQLAKILNVEPLWLMGFDVAMKKDLSCESAEQSAELIYKFSILSSRDKKIILDIIDSMICEK